METWLIILLSSLDILGIIFFIYIVNRNYRRSLKERAEYSHVNHYKEIRDKVTVRKETKTEESNFTGFGITNIVPIAVMLLGVGMVVMMITLVFSTVTETLDTSNQYNISQDTLNAIEGTGTIISYLPVITVAVVIAVILSLLMPLLSFGSSEEEKPKRRKKKMKHKEHYTKMRDDLTTRSKDTEEDLDIEEEDLEEE